MRRGYISLADTEKRVRPSSEGAPRSNAKPASLTNGIRVEELLTQGIVTISTATHPEIAEQPVKIFNGSKTLLSAKKLNSVGVETPRPGKRRLVVNFIGNDGRENTQNFDLDHAFVRVALDTNKPKPAPVADLHRANLDIIGEPISLGSGYETKIAELNQRAKGMKLTVAVNSKPASRPFTFDRIDIADGALTVRNSEGNSMGLVALNDKNTIVFQAVKS